MCARGCKYYHYLTFKPDVAYTVKQSEAKDISFDHPLSSSSSSKSIDGSGFVTEMWGQMQTHLDLYELSTHLDFNFKQMIYDSRQ